MGWAQDELASVDLGDKRLDKRIRKICDSFYQRPMSSINEACQSWKDTKAAYRLFENEKLTAHKILLPHREATVERVKNYETVLAIQDTTFFNFSQHKKKRGMGSIESRRRNLKGLLAHNTLITTTDGLPLGLFEQEIFARTGNKYEGKYYQVPIEQKEDYRWIRAAETVISYMPPSVRAVNVCDREADIYEFLDAVEKRNGYYLVRSNHNRIIGDKKKRWEKDEENTYLNEVISKEKIRGAIEIEIIDKKTKKSRKAKLNIKFCEVVIAAPNRLHWSYKNQPKIKCHIVDVEEPLPSDEHEKIHWRLLTNIPVVTLDDAIEKVLWYKQRWTVEVYHKVLKSGCTVEDCRLTDFKRLQRCITLYSIVAWRLLWMSRVGKDTPNLPCTLVFADHEWKILYAVTHDTKEVPKETPAIRDAIRWMAQLGGFLARKSDGEPGITTVWRGWQQLNTIAKVHNILNYG